MNVTELLSAVVIAAVSARTVAIALNESRPFRWFRNLILHLSAPPNPVVLPRAPRWPFLATESLYRYPGTGEIVPPGSVVVKEDGEAIAYSKDPVEVVPHKFAPLVDAGFWGEWITCKLCLSFFGSLVGALVAWVLVPGAGPEVMLVSVPAFGVATVIPYS